MRVPTMWLRKVGRQFICSTRIPSSSSKRCIESFVKTTPSRSLTVPTAHSANLELISMPTTYFTRDLSQVDKSVINGIRMALGASGLISLVFGVVMLAWPVKTAVVIAGMIALYAAIAGLANLVIGIFSRTLGTWPRVGYILLGMVFLATAAVAFANLKSAAAALAVLLGIMVGIVWIVEGIVGLTMIGDAPSKIWTVSYAALSIVAGVVLLTSPMWGAAMLWLLLGVSLVILGVIQVVRAFRFGRG